MSHCHMEKKKKEKNADFKIYSKNHTLFTVLERSFKRKIRFLNHALSTMSITSWEVFI